MPCDVLILILELFLLTWSSINLRRIIVLKTNMVQPSVKFQIAISTVYLVMATVPHFPSDVFQKGLPVDAGFEITTSPCMIVSANTGVSLKATVMKSTPILFVQTVEDT